MLPSNTKQDGAAADVKGKAKGRKHQLEQPTEQEQPKQKQQRKQTKKQGKGPPSDELDDNGGVKAQLQETAGQRGESGEQGGRAGAECDVDRSRTPVHGPKLTGVDLCLLLVQAAR